MNMFAIYASPQLRALIEAFEEQGVPVSGGDDNFVARCPNHEDQTPSLSLADGQKGVIMKCHADCDQDELFEAVVAFTGLRKSDFFYKKQVAPFVGTPVTVAELAAAKSLPVELFTRLGIHDSPLGVLIPYWNGTSPPRMRIRQALRASDGSRWQKAIGNTKITAYGAWCVPQLCTSGTLYLVEGETDTLTGWLYGLPVVGFPGKGTARRILEDNPQLVAGVSNIFVIEEPDDFRKRVFFNGVRRGLSDVHWQGNIYSMRLAEKDLSDLHVKRGAEGFWLAFLEAWEAAVDAPNWPDPKPVPPSVASICAIILGPGFPGTFGVRDIHRRMRDSDSAEIRHGLEVLEEARLVRRLPQARRVGRPQARYRVNPKGPRG